ncbi:Hypothetical predicted protein [Paramuricea clavata]|uniref:Uncharacterized protein n=1 Tax=Paramuricea clavata TaxID=317549 RepID=A0A7D9JNY7_PARCT|nr:Hypothetical predicted protein [Paramuricea clavata]
MAEELQAKMQTTSTKEKDVSESVPPVKQNAGQSTLQGMLESTSVFRRQFKIVGQIGQPNEKDKLSFTYLTRQIDTGVKQGYTEQEIVDGVIRSINGALKIKVEDTLVYENDHIQKLFLRTVETGLQDENVRVRVRGYLRNPTISDEELILQVNNAVSTENERVRKLRNQNRPKLAQVYQVAEKAESQDKILKTLEALKVEVAQVKSQLKDINQEIEQARLPNSPAPVDTRNQRRNTPPKCLQCQTSGNDKCSHCFICGSDNHFAIGCRQNRGKNTLNSRRLPLRGQK